MGYDVHITRKADWWDEDGEQISLDEWRAYVESDPTMRLDGVAEATTPDGATVRYENAGLAVWTAYSRRLSQGGDSWFDHRAGNVVVKNPDDESLSKMREIAESLEAKVQGDEGELYEPNPAPRRDTGRRPWWRRRT